MNVFATYLKCIDAEDDIWSDDVYSVAWSLSTPNIVWTTLTVSSDQSLGKSDWSGLDKGEERWGKRLVYPDWGGHDVQIAILEKDDGHDFHALASATKELEHFLQFMLSQVPPAQQALVMPMWFFYGIGRFKTNDDVIGFTSIKHTGQPVCKEETFMGKGVTYKVRFESKR